LRVAGWAALPCVRRIVDGALAVSITASGMAGAGAAPASADPPPSTTTAPVVIELDHRDRTPAPPSTARQGRELESVPTPAPTSDVAVPPVPAQAGPRPARAPLPPPGGPPDQHVVVPGDNLWTIAATHVGLAAERDPATLGDAEVASYWTRVIAENRTRLRSGDPDLILPGEVVQLPPLV
jgi:nucleoid-associated protein YgaU